MKVDLNFFDSKHVLIQKALNKVWRVYWQSKLMNRKKNKLFVNIISFLCETLNSRLLLLVITIRGSP